MNKIIVCDAINEAGFEILAKELKENEKIINDELLQVQGKGADIGGYYKFDPKKAEEILRPSKTLNKVIG